MRNGYKLVKYFKLNEVMRWGENGFNFNPFEDEGNYPSDDASYWPTALHESEKIHPDVEDTKTMKYYYDIENENVIQCWLIVCRKYYYENVARASFNSLSDLNTFLNSNETIPGHGTKTAIKTYEKFIVKCNSIFEKTYAYYNALLTGYKNVESELLAQIKEESTTTSSDSSSSDSTSTTSDTNKTTNNLEEKTTFADDVDVESQFNDTPQNTTDPFADGFTTNANKSKTSKSGNDTTTNTGTSETTGSGTNTTKGSGKSEGTSTTTRTIPYTPMQRLIEVQNAYKSVMAQWVDEFRVIVIEQQGDEEDEEF